MLRVVQLCAQVPFACGMLCGVPGVNPLRPLRPLFPYFGSKWLLARHYPAPQYPVVIEPFAGSACYALHHWRHRVQLYDVDGELCECWRWLLAGAPGVEQLPTEWPVGTQTEQMPKFLRMWLSPGAGHKRTAGGFAHAWNVRTRNRVAKAVQCIAHWSVACASYESLPDVEATWFVDPPYQHQGHQYINGSAGINYTALATWCRTRRGQVIVCEQAGATWLPFVPFKRMRASCGRNSDVKLEVYWSNR